MKESDHTICGYILGANMSAYPCLEWFDSERTYVHCCSIVCKYVCTAVLHARKMLLLSLSPPPPPPPLL